jgi:hypothetical protein
MAISLSRGILHGYSLRLELEVSYTPLDTTTTNPILRVIKMTVEYLLCQSEGPVEMLPDGTQIFQKNGIRRRYGRAWFFRGRCMRRK